MNEQEAATCYQEHIRVQLSLHLLTHFQRLRKGRQRKSRWQKSRDQIESRVESRAEKGRDDGDQAVARVPKSQASSYTWWILIFAFHLPGSLQMGGMEAVITGLADDFQVLKRHRKLFTLGVTLGTFLLALFCITKVRKVSACVTWNF